MSCLNIDRVYVRDAASGRIIGRREGVWSSTADACVDCGTTEKKHEAFGRCRRCYTNWKWATDAEWRARKLRLHKLSTIRNGDKIEERDKQRAKDPKRIAQRRVISNRWADKNSKWPRGCTVWYELIPGHWVSGTIKEKSNASALVAFKTCEQRILFRRLRRDQPCMVMEASA